MATFGLVGKKLGHSFSKNYFGKKFENEGLHQHRYLNFEIDDIKKIKDIWREYPDLIGMNVTIPYKTDVIPLLDTLDENARKVGAVNTIKIERNGSEIKTTGYNTDVVGFKNSLLPKLKPHHVKALVLGTGGASKAVTAVLDELKIVHTLVSRTPAKGQYSYKQLNQVIIKETPLIINSSPVGTFPNVNDAPDIPYTWLTENHYLFDLVYNPEETMFLKKGKNKEAAVKNGSDMLIGQAEAAWDIWTA